MSGISIYTQTTQMDLVLAMQLRLEELKSILLNDEDSMKSNAMDSDEETVGNRKVKDTTISIGCNQTKIDKDVFGNINWKSYSLATRALMDAVFDKNTLATSTLTGVNRISNKFKKQILDPLKLSDIVEVVQEKCNVNVMSIRKVISCKCNDTAKAMQFKKRK